MLPFTNEEFLGVFEQYNEAVWPMQIVLAAVGLLAVGLALGKGRRSDPFIGTVLAGLWLWAGIVYHVLFFSSINPAAYGFGALFVLQGLLFLHAGVIRGRLSFRWRLTSWGIAGAVLLTYALIVYPVLGDSLGHVYPRSPAFGVPCPTTIFTFGLLLWTERQFPRSLLIIPLLWAVVGSSAAFLLGIWEDLGLLVAGLVGAVGMPRPGRSR